MKVCVFTCDKYVSLFPELVPLTLKYLKRAGMRYPIQIVTNTTTIDYDDVVYLGPDRGWSNNLLKFVTDKTEPFILWLEEGICVEIDHRLLDLAVEESAKSKVGLVRLYPCPGPTLPWSDEIGEIDKSLPYAISCQVSIWHPNTLKDILRENETPWDFEISGSLRAKTYKPHFLGTYKSAVSYKEYTRRGQLNPDAVEWIERNT